MSPSLLRLSHCLLIGTLVSLIAGCSSSRSQFLASEYERGTFRGSSIALLPLSSEFGLADTTASEAKEDLQTAYFTNEGHKLFYRLFDLELEQVAAARVTNLGSDFRPENTSIHMQFLPLTEDSLRIPLPSGPVGTPNQQADFLLLIDELTFTPRSETRRSPQLGSARRRNNLYIRATCQYVLWDNRNARAAAYGRFEGRRQMATPNSRAPYENLFHRLAIHIIEESPIALSPQIRSRSTNGV